MENDVLYYIDGHGYVCIEILRWYMKNFWQRAVLLYFDGIYDAKRKSL